MNIAEQQLRRATADKRAKTIMADTATYVESVGKSDIDTLGIDLDARQVAVRLVLGATATMPFRALSYIESAARIALHIPNSQLQIVHANNLGNKINGTDLERTNDAARSLATRALSILHRFPELETRVIHAIDTPHDTDVFSDSVERAFATNQQLTAKMMQKGAKHSGDAIRYIAAHFAFQDTDELELNLLTGSRQQKADTIISVGCQQERNFYIARMGMRAFAIPTVDTAQIFTKHLTPPYYQARGGEPLLDDEINVDQIGDTSAKRDITHYITITTGENNG